jgi:hypothetical protein
VVTKYRAVRTEIDGIVFSSKREAAHYSSLKILQKAGYIAELALQPKFPMVVNGVKICTYIADFSFIDQSGNLCIHDVKGMRTPVFSLKAKLFHALYPDLRIIEIT